MDEPSKIERTLAKYTDAAALQAVANSVPYIGPLVNGLLQRRFVDLQSERLVKFFERLEQQSATITPEMLDDNDHCHAIISTMSAAARAQRTEKVHLFADLLSNYQQIVLTNGIEEYEEMLKILDDLTAQEYQALLELRRCEDSHIAMVRAVRPYPEDNLSLPRWAGNDKWDDFMRYLREHGMQEEEIEGRLARLRRTGLYETMPDPSNVFFFGHTTPLFTRFLRAVGRHEREHPPPERP